MARKSTRKKTAAELLQTPAETPAAETKSPPPQFEFNFTKFIATNDLNKSPPSSKKKKKEINLESIASPVGTLKNVSSISELKGLASSRLDSIKRHLDRSHAEIVKDIEASESRLHKRLKLQTQGCQQLMDEAEKEYKKMSDRIGEGRETMKASYSEFITEIQASSSRVFKSSLPELSQSFEKTIDSLKSRYGI